MIETQGTQALTSGNAAKFYCLNWIDSYLQRTEGSVSVLDLGCGTAGNFIALMKQYPRVRYIGVEPSKPACEQAERNLQGLDARIINADGYAVHDMLKEEFDLVVSFSVLEHVYQRERYLRSAKDCLKSDGYFLINYDAGHFKVGTPRDRVKNVVGPIFARVGIERYYQSFVPEQQFRGIVQTLDMRIVDEKFFNSRLKGVYKAIPDAQRAEYMNRWLDFELWLNSIGIAYDDSKAGMFVTRNFILQR